MPPLRTLSTKRTTDNCWHEEREARKIANNIVRGTKDEARNAIAKYAECPAAMKDDIGATVRSLESLRQLREIVWMEEQRKFW